MSLVALLTEIRDTMIKSTWADAQPLLNKINTALANVKPRPLVTRNCPKCQARMKDIGTMPKMRGLKPVKIWFCRTCNVSAPIRRHKKLRSTY